MTDKHIRTIYNCQTGEIITEEMTSEEIAELPVFVEPLGKADDASEPS